MTTLTLTEYVPRRLPRQALGHAAVTALWRTYGDRLQVEFPSPKTEGQWQLTALGWAGVLPLTPQLILRVQPKVPLHNLFRMWEVAYDFDRLHLLPGLVDADSLEDFYARLAHVLARRVLLRARRGFQRAYLPRRAQLPYLRGRLDVRAVGQRPFSPTLPCRFDHQTSDIPDNQILATTLKLIARSGLVDGAVQTSVRRAYRALQGVATPQPFTPDDCRGRFYTRLNADYAPLHALCRFFLAHTGPGHAAGAQPMLPFWVDMAALFEVFVAAWLAGHLPPGWRVQPQERVALGAAGEVRLEIDLVLYDENGFAQAVLDTKYKTPDRPATADFSQIVTYAKAKGCREAMLIYPAPLAHPLDVTIDDLRVRTLIFDLGGALDDAGRALLAQLPLPR